jgi:nitrogen regulatory protein P-II 1
MLKKIECFVTPGRLDEVKAALIEKGVEGMSISEVLGFGRQQEIMLRERGPAAVPLERRMKIEIVVEEERLDPITAELKRLARTGASGAGMIFILPVEEAIRLATEEQGRLAIR